VIYFKVCGIDSVYTPSPNAQPNRWYHEGMWREVLSPHDEIGAGRARHALAAEGLYPTRDQSGDPGLAGLFEWIEANTRANLRFWVAQGVLPAEVLEG
jgi:hypothetical protein